MTEAHPIDDVLLGDSAVGHVIGARERGPRTMLDPETPPPLDPETPPPLEP